MRPDRRRPRVAAELRVAWDDRILRGPVDRHRTGAVRWCLRNFASRGTTGSSATAWRGRRQRPVRPSRGTSRRVGRPGPPQSHGGGGGSGRFGPAAELHVAWDDPILRNRRTSGPPLMRTPRQLRCVDPGSDLPAPQELWRHVGASGAPGPAMASLAQPPSARITSQAGSLRSGSRRRVGFFARQASLTPESRAAAASSRVSAFC